MKPSVRWDLGQIYESIPAQKEAAISYTAPINVMLGIYGIPGCMALPIFQEILNVVSYKSQNHILKVNQNVSCEPTQNCTPGPPFGDLHSDRDNYHYQ